MVNHNLGMKLGTSPSIARLSNGTYQVAFQANDGQLYTRNSSANGTATNLGLGMGNTSSPRIAAKSAGGWQIAFLANTTTLFTTDSAGSVIDRTLGMATNTSPAIV